MLSAGHLLVAFYPRTTDMQSHINVYRLPVFDIACAAQAAAPPAMVNQSVGASGRAVQGSAPLSEATARKTFRQTIHPAIARR